MCSSLLQDGTVGEDLVVRPLPVSLHQLARGEMTQKKKEDEDNENHLAPPDDEFFMDEAEELGDQMVFSDGLPLNADDTSNTGSLLDLQQLPSEGGTNGTLPEGLTLLKRRRRQTESEGFHIVYKREAPTVDTDYGISCKESNPLNTDPDIYKAAQVT
ncbi:hypothetical protein Pcinc_044412 [Petrolisthes cinctipes]|uniref:Uncharacterized protein n=1 Tax=Petrolisthes cinctipes TaxID=88211 RepID=A0AAE1BEZ5_PETCI|nr:hypothetical protein Pcinc_044412 [Petrolisthes cinctipes]